jgi:hypothetical protein
MWRPAELRLGYLGRPVTRGPQLGQSSSVINQAASAVVAQAEPRVRAIVAEERSRLANAAIQGLPYVGGALTALLTTQYLLPKDKKVVRGVGYVTSAALFTVGAWKALEQAAGPDSAPPEPSTESGVLSIFGDTARQMAQVVVSEAEPKMRAIINDERAKIAEAATASLPLIGASVAGFLATAFLVPEDKNTWKFGGYLISAGALLGGLWKGLTVAS